jgi:thioredoxin reductase
VTHPHDDPTPVEHDPTGMRDLLAALPDPGPMPEDLVARITAALAEESRAAALSASPDAGNVVPLRPRRGGLRHLGVAAAVVTAIGLGGVALTSWPGSLTAQLNASSGSDAGSDVAAGAEEAQVDEDAASKGGADLSAPALPDTAGAGAVTVIMSGTDHEAATLGQSVRALEGEAVAPLTPSDVRNVIIIGSGPAGYTAAVYAARANLEPLMFEGAVTAGGALMNTTEVENFPGFRDGIMGPDLMENMRAQAERFGAETHHRRRGVRAISRATSRSCGLRGHRVPARAVILAMGSAYRELGLPDEKRLSGHGVSWCATCDGFFFRDQDIAVVGGGDSAVEEATFLTKFARSVTIVHRRDELRASKIMAERAARQREDLVRVEQRRRRHPRRRQADGNHVARHRDW